MRLTNTDTKKLWISWTDESGKFEFPALPGGHYRVEASQLGFVPSEVEVQLPATSTIPIALVLRVAALADLAAASESASSNKVATGNGKPDAIGGSENAATNPGNVSLANPNDPGRRGRGRLPPGVVNAIRQGMALGGFQAADLGSEANPAGQGEENPSSANEDPQLTPLASSSAESASSSDSFLLQGTVGQGLSPNGTNGPGEPGGPNGGGSRMLRQAVNRIRFGFYDRYENSIWDARPYSITGVESPRISHYSERVGANVGGPLRIPHVYNGSDRTFFFVNYQREIEKRPVDSFATVPAIAERGGDFSALGVQLFDPASNIAGPRVLLGSKIPSGRINSAAAGLLARIPLPNLPGTVQNFHLQATTPLESDRLNLRLLHTLNSKFNLNADYNFNSQRLNALVNFPGFGSHRSTRNQNVNLGLTHQRTSRLAEDMHLNWSRSRIRTLSDNSFGPDIAGNLGITGISTDPINFGIPGINFTDFSNWNDPVPALTRNQTLRFSDNLSYVRTKHALRFGGEIRRIQLNSDTDPIPRGQFIFTGLMTSQLDSKGNPVPGTGNDFADFLLGFPQATTSRFGDPSLYFRSWGFIAYAQDDWRVNSRFTVKYGVRYEAATPPVEKYDRLANLDFNSQFTQAAIVTPGEIGPLSGLSYSQALVHGNYLNWAPRIGFAWEPNLRPKTVVRAGYSIFYDESIYNTLATSYLAYQPPFAEAQTRLTTPTLVLTLKDGFSGTVSQSSTQVLNTAAVDPFYNNGYAQIWMFGTETELSPGWMLNLTYTGTKGTDLDLLRAPNRAPPGSPLNTDNNRRISNAGGFTLDQSGANSIYNALQVRLVHRFTHGLMVQGIYTFAKLIDNASSIGGGTPVVVQNDNDFAAERRLSSFDIRHRFRALSLYELPFGQRKRWANHGWAEHVFGSWRVMNVLTWKTGTPFTALLGGTASDNAGTGANFSTRADQVGDPNLGLCGGSPLHFFNTAAFAAPPPGLFGNAARNTIEGPCTFSWNFSLAKYFRFGPSDRQHRLEARWEIQNMTNTPNFNGLATVFGSSSFGRVTSAASMRTMTIMLRVNF